MPRSLILFLLFSLSCATTPGTDTPVFAPTGTAKRVVLMSFDGLGADALARQPDLPAFERLAQEGMSARVVNVNPTHTSSTHVSILTGADPQRHGVVANRFHLPGTPPDRATHGLATEIEVETLVEAARRQGRRVGVVSFPTVDNTSSRRTADFGLAWTRPAAPSRIVTLTRADFRSEWVPPTWSTRPQRRPSFSPVMRARIDWRVPSAVRADIHILAYDTTDDRIANYDSYYVEFDDRELAPDARGWFAIARQTPAGLYGSWSKVLRATPSLEVTIYRGSTSRTDAWPAAFRDLIDREAGFWPGVPEEELEVGPEVFADQMERLAAFFTRAQKTAIEQMPFDLLLLYQPQIDQASHRFLGVAGGEQVVRSAFAAADRAIESVAEALEPNDALVVTGDHGAVVAMKEIRMNRLLADRGFARWKAFTSGSVAHLYFVDGASVPHRAPEAEIAALIAMLRDHGSFEVVEAKNASHHPNSGDVIAWAYPEVALSHLDTAPAIVTPQPRGQHGARNTHRELQPPLFAYGAGIRAGATGEIRQTQIARFVAGLLGIAPPAAAE